MTVTIENERRGREALDSAFLDQMQLVADPLADRTVAAIFDPLHDSPIDSSDAEILNANAPLWQRIRIANALITQWKTNGELGTWQPDLNVIANANPVEAAVIGDVLRAYLAEGHQLPPWADASQIAVAERVFFDHGVLSCLLLFCASLPQCYVLPDLSDVLHAAGQLEAHTEHRIRSTAAMIFPVMLAGGLTSADGSGVTQVLKVRLIHAMIRHLVLRGAPESAVLALTQDAVIPTPPLAIADAGRDMYRTLFAHGWAIERDGLPCNQEELAYTLLTFHYVFVDGMRTLGVPLPPDEERAYLHCWNVVSHVLGIDRRLTQDDLTPARAAFELMQARGRADAAKRPPATDPRPKLGVALMASMERVIPLSVLRGVPSLLTKTLCGKEVVSELGIDHRASAAQRLFYVIVFGGARAIDAVARLVWKNFSLAKLMSRIVGYHLLTKLLLDQTRPLRLPDRLLDQIEGQVSDWSDDRRAPKWMNRLEDRFTTQGEWNLAQRKAATMRANK